MEQKINVKQLEKILLKETNLLSYNTLNPYLKIESVSHYMKDGTIEIEGVYGFDIEGGLRELFSMTFKETESIDFIRGKFARIVEEKEN